MEVKMSKRKIDVLRRIPDNKLSVREREFRWAVLEDRNVPLFRFSRIPRTLSDINWEGYKLIAIQKQNTFICVNRFFYQQFFKQTKRHVTFSILNVGETYRLKCAIYGETDTEVAETATWFWSLQHPEHPHASLQVDYDTVFGRVDLAAFTAEQLTRLLDANRTRELGLSVGSWTPEQAVILATRPYCMNLRLDRVPSMDAPNNNRDDGMEWIQALEKRQLPFGSLKIVCERNGFPFIGTHLERLVQLDRKFHKLIIGFLDEENILIPFSAKVDALDYAIEATYVQPEHFHSLNIVTKDLDLLILVNHTDNAVGPLLISLLNRVAELGHFERLGITLQSQNDHHGEQLDPGDVAQALLAVINSNAKLTHLKLNNFEFLFCLFPHLEDIFHAIGEHQGIRTVTMFTFPPVKLYRRTTEDYKSKESRYYAVLERLLSRNRTITVLHNAKDKCTNGTTIDKLYALNSFYNGSTKLKQECAELRQLLVMTALTESASSNPQYTGILLSQYTDVLCESVYGILLDENIDSSAELKTEIEDDPRRRMRERNVNRSAFPPLIFRGIF